MERACKKRPEVDTIEPILRTDLDEPTNNTGGGCQHPKTPVAEVSLSDDQTDRTDLGREMHFPQDIMSDVRSCNEERHDIGPTALDHTHQRQGRSRTVSYHENHNHTTADRCKAPINIIPYKNVTTTLASAADTNTTDYSWRNMASKTPAPKPETGNQSDVVCL